jgi:hypothetical protein
MTKAVIFPKIEENGVIIYPDDISMFANTRLNPDGLSIIADYSGDKDLPIYIPPTPKTRRIISTLEFYKRLPTRLMIALINPDIVADIETHTMLKVFNNYIQCSQVAGEDGLTFGVDLNDNMVTEGFSEALRLGLVTQAEMDEILK